MELIEGIEKIVEPLHNAVVTIGNFDGVHLGHQALFNMVIEKARPIDGRAVAITFEPHPVRVLKQNGLPPLITVYERKIELIARTGIDVLICIQFTPEFAALSPRAFVVDLLVKRIGMKAIVIGEDYAFGKNREGNLALLQEYGREFDFNVYTVGEIRTSDGSVQRISSTRIRDLVTQGDVDSARILLGRNYQVRGDVIPGRNRGGRQLGFPTANIRIQNELCPKIGSYAVMVDLENTSCPGVANIGYSPTFDDRQFTVEVHLIGFSGDLYGKHLRVNFVKRLRGEKRFGSPAELSAQIKRDVAEALKIMAAPGSSATI